MPAAKRNVVRSKVETHPGGGDNLVNKRKTQIILALGVATVLALLYLLSPVFRTEVQRAFVLLARADIEQLKEYLLSFGAWAPIVSGSLMVLQSLLVPLPAMVITLANGLLFGTIGGALLSWSSAMVGAILCYYISRLFGRPVVEKLVGKKSLDMADRFFQRYGKHAVLIARLIPVISFDVVSYAAGLTSIGLWEFILATGIGQMPATVVYSFLGQNMPKAARLGLWITLGVMASLTLGFAVKARFEEGLFSEGR